MTNAGPHVGEMIRTAREYRGVRRADMARAIGMDYSNYKRLEKSATCKFDLLVRVAGALGCDVRLVARPGT